MNINDYISEIDTLSTDRIMYISLETNEECLIGNIDKIIYQGEKYYILDKLQSSIFIFLENGKHATTIHRVGSGPNEYVDITDFDVDGNNNIYVGSGNSRKIIKYLYPAYNEAFEWNIPSAFLELAVDNRTEKIWIANILDYKGCIPISLFEDGQMQTKLSPRNVLDNIEKGFKAQSFYKSGDNLYFNPRYSPYIYQINNEDIVPVFQIKSENFVSEENFLNPVPNTEGLRNAMIYGVKSFYKIDNAFYGELWSSAMRSTLIKYDLEKRQGALINPMSKLNHFSGIMADTPNALILKIPANFVDKKVSDFEKNPYLIKISF